jgi:predicted dithiol-disulfide oxidoreductase (DUF899 family)
VITEHKVVGRQEWRAARPELLQREKARTRMADELARQRRELPCVAIERSTGSTRPGPMSWDTGRSHRR